jgi:hypothetical protein
MGNSLSLTLDRVLSNSKFLPACFLLFLGLRLALVLLVPVAPWSDAAWYYGRAVTLAAEGAYAETGLPTAFWPIGYPGFLGLLFRVTGPSVAVAQGANLVFAAASFALAYSVTKRLFESERAARLAVLMLTIYPNNAAYVPLLLTETLYSFLLLSAIWLLCSRGIRGRLVLAALVFALGILVKTQTVLLVPIVAFLILWDRWAVRDAARPAIEAVLVTSMALLILAPWTYRNYRTFGHFILVSTNGGISLLEGNNSSVVGDYAHDFSYTDPLVKAAGFSVRDQVAADGRARSLALHWIRAHPRDFLLLMPKKIFRLWAPDGEAEWGYQAGTAWYDRYSTWFYVLVLVLAAGGVKVLLGRRARPATFAGVAVAATTTLISLVFSGQSRYHFAVMPLLLGYAGLYAHVLMRPPTCNTVRPAGRL